MNHQKLMSMKVKPWHYLLLLTPIPYAYFGLRDFFEDDVESSSAGAVAMMLLPLAVFMSVMNFAVIDYSIRALKPQTTYQQVIK